MAAVSYDDRCCGGACSRRRRQISSPSIPGNITSSKIASGSQRRTSVRPARLARHARRIRRDSIDGEQIASTCRRPPRGCGAASRHWQKPQGPPGLQIAKRFCKCRVDVGIRTSALRMFAVAVPTLRLYCQKCSW